MLVVIETLVLLVQRVVSQVSKHVGKVCLVVLFGRQTHETVLVDKNLHRVNHTEQKNVDSEVILVTLPECWILEVLLYNKRTFFVEAILVFFIITVAHGSVIVFFLLEILIILLLLCLKDLINFDFELVKLFANENALSLTACFWLDNKKYRGISLGFFLRNDTSLQVFLSLFVLFVVVLKNLMLILRVQPGVREKIVMLAEFLSKPSQMDS